MSVGSWIEENIFGKSQYKAKNPELPDSYAALMGKQGVMSEYDKQKALEQEFIKSGQETPVSIAQQKNAQQEMKSRLNVSTAGVPTSLRGYGKQGNAMLQTGGMQQIARDTEIAKENEKAAAMANQGNILNLQTQGQGQIYSGIAGQDRMMDSAKVGVTTQNAATDTANAANAQAVWGAGLNAGGAGTVAAAGGATPTQALGAGASGTYSNQWGQQPYGAPANQYGPGIQQPAPGPYSSSPEVIQSDKKNKKTIKNDDGGKDALMKISESLAAIAGLNERLKKIEKKRK